LPAETHELSDDERGAPPVHVAAPMARIHPGIRHQHAMGGRTHDLADPRHERSGRHEPQVVDGPALPVLSDESPALLRLPALHPFPRRIEMPGGLFPRIAVEPPELNRANARGPRSRLFPPIPLRP